MPYLLPATLRIDWTRRLPVLMVLLLIPLFWRVAY